MRAVGFAGFAPLGLVLEALVGEEHLLTGGEYELRSALRALQDLVVVFHTLLRVRVRVERAPKSTENRAWEIRMGSGAAPIRRRTEYPLAPADIDAPLARSCLE